MRIYVFVSFALLLVVSGFLFSKSLKYVIFPREESKDFRVKVVATESTTRHEMAKKIQEVENIFLSHSSVVGIH